MILTGSSSVNQIWFLTLPLQCSDVSLLKQGSMSAPTGVKLVHTPVKTYIV